MTPERFLPDDLRRRKNGVPIVCLTAYTAPTARLLDPHVDLLLVGDSLGMVVYGMENTRGVTLDLMIAHGRAVANASRRACVIVDMPFGSYQSSPEEALRACTRVMSDTGAQGVKLEGGTEMAPTIAYLVQNRIPVMGHVGLMPQQVKTSADYRYWGRTDEEKKCIIADALAVERAGAFSLVIEAVREDVAREATRRLAIPTIGIGASPACDGQVLVIDDMLGLTERAPRFVKRYAELASVIEAAARTYAEEVRSRRFPDRQHCYGGNEQKH